MRRRILAGLGLVAIGVFAGVACAIVTSAPRPAARGTDRITQGGWVTSWSGSPQPTGPGWHAAAGLAGRTVRDIVFTSAGGSAIRLVVSNAFGTEALRVGAATVAVTDGGAAVVPGTMRAVRFGGSASVSIPPGARVLSDPVPLRVSSRDTSG